MMCRFLLCMCVASLFGGHAAIAEDYAAALPVASPADAFNVGLPVDVSSDALSYDRTSGAAHFSGGVVIRRGGMTLQAEDVRVSMDGDMLKEIVAETNVVLKQKNDVATGARAVFSPQSKLIQLTGDVALVREQSKLSGESLIYNLDTGEMQLKSAKQGRVSASFTLKSKGE